MKRVIHSRSQKQYRTTIRTQAKIELRLIDILTGMGYIFRENKTLAEILVEDERAYKLLLDSGHAKMAVRLMQYNERRSEAVSNGITPANELAKSNWHKAGPPTASKPKVLQIALPLFTDWREGWWKLQQALHSS